MLDEVITNDDIAEPSTAQEAESNEIITEGSATETPQFKKPNKVQERINQLAREKNEARQRNADLEERIKTLESNTVVKETTHKAAPKVEDFDDYSEFETAKEHHIVSQAVQAAYDRMTAEQNAKSATIQAEARAVELKSKKQAFDQNVDQKRGNFEEFEEVAYGHSFMDIDLAERIFEMDKGPEVAYHIGANLDFAEQIFNMTPVQRAQELKNLELSLEGVNPKRVSGAPEPITPISGSENSGNKSPNEMTDKEWLAWRYNQLNARNKHG